MTNHPSSPGCLLEACQEDKRYMVAMGKDNTPFSQEPYANVKKKEMVK